LDDDRAVDPQATERTMRELRLSTIGAICAILTTVSFVTGGVLLGSSGVQDLIPHTGADGLAWIADVNDASDLFFVGAWLIILTTLVGTVALVGFYDVLKDAGPVMILAPIVGTVGLTLVTISHLLPIALAYEFVPGYVDADEAMQASLAVTFDTFANLSLILNYVGNVLGWGVAVPLYAIAILKTSVVPKWIGWLGLVVAALAGWLGLLAPASGVIEGITAIGFIAFFVFMLSMGIAILLRQRPGRSLSVSR
jgi:hypothetical protein